MKAVQFEDAILGALFYQDDTQLERASAVLSELSAVAFTDKNRAIYEAIQRTSQAHRPITPLEVSARYEGESKDINYAALALTRLGLDSISGWEGWVRIVDNTGRVRKVREEALRVVAETENLDKIALGENVDGWIAEVTSNLTAAQSYNQSGYQPISTFVDEFQRVIRGGSVVVDHLPTFFPTEVFPHPSPPSRVNRIPRLFILSPHLF